ncbi:DnaD domain protein [Suipraeoptans intestinalis]|uniref:DnaD domain protein n=1 Tax=Suipraeoptans intestinalis TaxID=2606628 RepID=UPI002A75243F|nr:DnaD domain protein [Suipraeoptans intestinalis]MDY3121075.1 DnaD domain protein [Suipraeoptans intestinalis]
MRIPILSGGTSNTTTIENTFIDQYMASANGEYVKVYLLLLRRSCNGLDPWSVSQLADFLDCTEKDIVRACNYWKKAGLLEYQESSASSSVPASNAGASEEAGFASSEKSKKVSYGQRTDEKKSSPATVLSLSESKTASSAKKTPTKRTSSQKALKQLIHVAEQYLGKTLSASDMETIQYFLTDLEFSPDLIDYLLEYCVEYDHKSMHYIKKVALSWKEQQVTTIEEAKAASSRYNTAAYSILKAYGIQNRAPAPVEETYIKKWTRTFGFAMDVILEACSRTIRTIHQPSFEYTDSILSNWKEQGLSSLSDVQEADLKYLQEKEAKKKTKSSSKTSSPNRFNNFDGRSYDMNDMERRLIQQ